MLPPPFESTNTKNIYDDGVVADMTEAQPIDSILKYTHVCIEEQILLVSVRRISITNARHAINWIISNRRLIGLHSFISTHTHKHTHIWIWQRERKFSSHLIRMDLLLYVTFPTIRGGDWAVDEDVVHASIKLRSASAWYVNVCKESICSTETYRFRHMAGREIMHRAVVKALQSLCGWISEEDVPVTITL